MYDLLSRLNLFHTSNNNHHFTVFLDKDNKKHFVRKLGILVNNVNIEEYLKFIRSL